MPPPHPPSPRTTVRPRLTQVNVGGERRWSDCPSPSSAKPPCSVCTGGTGGSVTVSPCSKKTTHRYLPSDCPDQDGPLQEPCLHKRAETHERWPPRWFSHHKGSHREAWLGAVATGQFCCSSDHLPRSPSHIQQKSQPPSRSQQPASPPFVTRVDEGKKSIRIN